jgi:hypothetical protein
MASSMTYELWDTETGNLVEAFDDEVTALNAARELIALNPDAYPSLLTLLSVGANGELETVASGGEIGVLAASLPDTPSRRLG